MYLIPIAKQYPKNVLPLQFKLRLFHKLPQRTMSTTSGRTIPAPRRNGPVTYLQVAWMEDQRVRKTIRMTRIMFRMGKREWDIQCKSRVPNSIEDFDGLNTLIDNEVGC
jgi:hypothetical protein